MPWAKRRLPAFRFLLVAVKCANHQANLAMCVAVVGARAICVGGNGNATAARKDAATCRKQRAAAVGNPRRVVRGATVRVAKYLVDIYDEDVLASLTTIAAWLTFDAPTPESAAPALP